MSQESNTIANGAGLGAALGAVAACVYYDALYWCVAPQLLYDGPGFFLIAACLCLAPQGAWLGAATGGAVAAARGGAGRKAALVSVGGALLFLTVPVWFVVRDPLHLYPFEPSERWGQLGLYFSGGLLWAAVLLTWGCRRWARPRAA